jgi:hypothetical protein
VVRLHQGGYCRPQHRAIDLQEDHWRDAEHPQTHVGTARQVRHRPRHRNQCRDYSNDLAREDYDEDQVADNTLAARRLSRRWQPRIAWLSLQSIATALGWGAGAFYLGLGGW